MTVTHDIRLVLLAAASYTAIAQGRAQPLWLGGAIAKALVEQGGTPGVESKLGQSNLNLSPLPIQLGGQG